VRYEVENRGMNGYAIKHGDRTIAEMLTFDDVQALIFNPAIVVEWVKQVANSSVGAAIPAQTLLDRLGIPWRAQSGVPDNTKPQENVSLDNQSKVPN
jgi:hypothetical protein